MSDKIGPVLVTALRNQFAINHNEITKRFKAGDYVTVCALSAAQAKIAAYLEAAKKTGDLPEQQKPQAGGIVQ